MGDYGGYPNRVAAGGAITSSAYSHRQVHSAFGDQTACSQSEEDKPAQEKTKKKKKNRHLAEEGEHYYDSSEYDPGNHEGYTQVEGATEKTKKKKNRQLERLQEVTDTHSDPGCGDGTSLYDYSRSQSIHIVSSWLQDTSLAAHAPPVRRPPPRRHAPGADPVARSVSLPNHLDDSQEMQLAVYEHPQPVSSGNKKPLDKAMKAVRTKAVELGKVSKSAAGTFKRNTIEFANRAAPVMEPFLKAVLEESEKALLGPDGVSGIFDQPGGANLRGGRGGLGGRGGRGGRGGQGGHGGRGGQMSGQPPTMEGMVASMVGGTMKGMPLRPRPSMIPRPMIRPANGTMPRSANGLMPRLASGAMPRLGNGLVPRPTNCLMPRPAGGMMPSLANGLIPTLANDMMPRPVNGVMPRLMIKPDIRPPPCVMIRPGMMPRSMMRPSMGPPPPGAIANPGMMPRPMMRPGMRPPPTGTMVACAQGVVAMEGQLQPQGRAIPAPLD